METTKRLILLPADRFSPLMARNFVSSIKQEGDHLRRTLYGWELLDNNNQILLSYDLTRYKITVH